MADFSWKIDLEKFVSFNDDLVKLLLDKKDINNLTFFLQQSQALESSCVSDFAEVQKCLQDVERKIEECKKKTEEAKSKTITDEEMDRIQKQVEEELEKERMVMENLSEINDLDLQRISIEERMKELKKYEKSRLREKMALSMCASVTNIIPILGDGSKAEGYIVDGQKKVKDKFEFDFAETTSYDVYAKIWNMLDKP